MSIENEFFEISQIKSRSQKSRELTSNRNPREPIRVRVGSMSVRCKKCGAEWTAVPGHLDGQLKQVVGFVNITCPECKTEGAVSSQSLKQP